MLYRYPENAELDSRPKIIVGLDIIIIIIVNINSMRADREDWVTNMRWCADERCVTTKPLPKRRRANNDNNIINTDVRYKI